MTWFIQQINSMRVWGEREMEVLQNINRKKWVEHVEILIQTGQLYKDLFETN